MFQFIVIICCHHNKIFHITSLNFPNINTIIKAANSSLLQQIVFQDHHTKWHQYSYEAKSLKQLPCLYYLWQSITE